MPSTRICQKSNNYIINVFINGHLRSIKGVDVERQGVLVISLDLEMLWGDARWQRNGYGETHVSHVREVVRRLQEMFHEYQVKATVVVVGELMLPATGDNDSEHALDIIEQLKTDPNIEIGTHTFSHYCLLEDEHGEQGFEADLQKAIDVAKANGITVRSIAFPRNEISEEALKACHRMGITAYRGNAVKYFDEPRSKWQEIKQRACRLLDAYLNIGGYTSCPWPTPATVVPLNVRASRFLRPYSKPLAWLDGLRLRRIRQEMEHAAQTGGIYHLWWHPHNMGANADESFAFLRKVLDVYKDCHERYGMQSMAMGEVERKLTERRE